MVLSPTKFAGQLSGTRHFKLSLCPIECHPREANCRSKKTR